uniref:Alpha-carbonic anhydrase domain-containing protein n=1 Tax=Glossina brevipalpis TaxID=37001 RepID=A0A1A9WRQ0_9MUSC
MHIVHRNTLYETVDEATMHPDGLAVLGIFFERSNNPTFSYPGLNEIFNVLPEVREYESSAQLNNRITMRQLLGNVNTKVFFSYSGSLTTPPCSEAVRWFVFPDPLTISEEQINRFFLILDPNGIKQDSMLLSDFVDLSGVDIDIDDEGLHAKGTAAVVLWDIEQTDRVTVNTDRYGRIVEFSCDIIT